MTRSNMQHIPLTGAYLCPDCNSVGNCAMSCPACASTVVLSLSVVLNRGAEASSEATQVPQHPWMEAVAA
jgi:hypothetical protein